MEKELPKISSARLTKENYSVHLGRECPLCQHEYLDADGFSKWVVYIDEQNLIGYSDAPWAVGKNKYKNCAAVFECPECGGIYWFHWNIISLKRQWEKQKKNSPKIEK